MRFRDVEFRWSNCNKKYELVKWYKDVGLLEDKELCYVIAFFDETKEGYYDLRTVGNRFFEDKDAWIVGKHAIEFLNDISQELRNEKELE